MKWLCAVVEIARSSFYAWLAAADHRAAKTAADQALARGIRTAHDEDSTYGAPRITAELNDGSPAADRVNRKRVARLMRSFGIAGYRRKRRVTTTVPDPAAQKVPDLLNRDFTAAPPNTSYVGDITHLPPATGGNLYLAAPASTAAHGGWRGGRSPSICAPNSSRTPSRPPTGCAATSPAPYSIPITGVRADSNGRFNTSMVEVLMGRPAGWMKGVDGGAHR